MTAQIAQANESDLQDLETFARFIFREIFSYIGYSEENLRLYDETMLSAEYFRNYLTKGEVLIARDDHRVVGYSILGPLTVPAKNPPLNHCEIVRLYLHPDYHGTGLAQQFMDRMMNGRDDKVIYLSVYHENVPAQRFYQKYGFEKVGEYDYLVGEHVDREWIMQRAPLA